MARILVATDSPNHIVRILKTKINGSTFQVRIFEEPFMFFPEYHKTQKRPPLSETSSEFSVASSSPAKSAHSKQPPSSILSPTNSHATASSGPKETFPVVPSITPRSSEKLLPQQSVADMSDPLSPEKAIDSSSFSHIPLTTEEPPLKIIVGPDSASSPVSQKEATSPCILNRQGLSPIADAKLDSVVSSIKELDSNDVDLNENMAQIHKKVKFFYSRKKSKKSKATKIIEPIKSSLDISKLTRSSSRRGRSRKGKSLTSLLSTTTISQDSSKSTEDFSISDGCFENVNSRIRSQSKTTEILTSEGENIWELVNLMGIGSRRQHKDFVSYINNLEVEDKKQWASICNEEES